MIELGKQMYKFCENIYPICRSITGNGVRKTLLFIKKILSNLQIHEVPTGTKAFDWNVPREWNIKDAYIIDPDGEKIIDFKESNLHIIGYSLSVNRTLELKKLQEHLYSLPDQPDAIPYVTSYYKERWGFCLTDKQRKLLKPGKYRVYIDSTLKDGSLTYGELILPGYLDSEIFLSTYICHPSMANNECSGIAVTTHLAKWLQTMEQRKYTYRIVFIPETIGSIVYLSKNLEQMKKNIIAGYNITCIGDEGEYSYLPSRFGNTLSDRVAKHVLKHSHPEYTEYSFLDRGSDERQYCSPGVDLPVASIMRTKYGNYPEYHTSLDNLDFVTPNGLSDGYEVVKKCIECIERNEKFKVTVLCEPQLSKRGLYPTLSKKRNNSEIKDMMNLLAYSDGKKDLLEIADIINKPVWELYPIVEKLVEHKLIKAL